VHEWLAAASARIAQGVGDDASEYELTDADVERLLELARVAAHESGDRTNAPLVCYLVGLARGRRQGTDLAELVDDVVNKRA
jgi:Domain of unknown function (DUF6457)